MKAKYLKKLRKRYTWAWSTLHCAWKVVDHKMKRVHTHSSAYGFISSTLSLNEQIKYSQKVYERECEITYRRYSKLYPLKTK